MAIRQISQVSCSLNLGDIFNVSYSWAPDRGIEMTVFFSKQNGQYIKPTYLQQKAFIRIGSASFSLYAAASKISLSSGRRVIEVTFQDEFYQLEKHHVVLTGRGCGFNVYPLGRAVDNRTAAQKQAAALDPTAQQIVDFTQFSDVEYTFNDFLTVLRQQFNVQINAFYNTTITNPFVGTFGEVLQSWCSFFNLSFFFENGVIKIFNPTTLNINLPTQSSLISDKIIEYEEEEDARDTYGQTVCNYFQQEGGQYSLNQTSDSNGSLLVRAATLYPIGYEFNLPQVPVDLSQVAAAQYGQEFWTLYNYVKGSMAAECGFIPLTATTANQVSAVSSLTGVGCRIALQNSEVYQGKFEAYKTYGESIAGRWYLSNRVETLAIDKTYTWFDESEGQIVTFDNIDDKSIGLDFLTPVGNGINIIPGTTVNQFYSGINYIGNRIAYKDNAPIVANTNLGSLPVAQTYQAIFNVGGSSSFDFSAFDNVATGAFIATAYSTSVPVPQAIQLLINDIPNQISGFQPRFTSVPIKGITQLDYSTLKSSQNEPEGVEIITNQGGPNVVSNTAVIKTLKDGAYTVYYDKYSKCASASSTAPAYFGHHFNPRQISTDNTIDFSFSKDANNTYTINRDFAQINALVNNPLLPTLAQPRSFLTKRVNFTVNYFRDVPTNFLTNGLIGMNVSVGGDGVTCSYSFSNEVLDVPNHEDRYSQYEQSIRNSFIRQYRPNQVIT